MAAGLHASVSWGLHGLRYVAFNLSARAELHEHGAVLVYVPGWLTALLNCHVAYGVHSEDMERSCGHRDIFEASERQRYISRVNASRPRGVNGHRPGFSDSNFLSI